MFEIDFSDYEEQLKSAEESDYELPPLFEPEEDDYYPAMEAGEMDKVEAALNNAEKIINNADSKGNKKDTAKEEPKEEDDKTEDNDTKKDKDTDKDDDKEPDDVAEETDSQLEEDEQSSDDEIEGSNEEDAETDGDETSTDEETADDSDDEDAVLKSVDTKSAFRDKFVILYKSICDSLDAMEDFTPEYNTKSSRTYYEIRSDLTELKQAIFKYCVTRLSKNSVDEVLRQYTKCNLLYDTIINDTHAFAKAYNSELHKIFKTRSSKKVNYDY